MKRSQDYFEKIIGQLRNNENIELTESQMIALREFITTKRNLFISGSAGTGKSFIINLLQRFEDCVIAAPTGIAALNAGGSTLHRIFRLPFGLLTEPYDTDYHNLYTAKLLRKIKTLIIDEISMVRADVFDALDRRMRFANNSKEPFGGIRVVVIGDFYQLPPVIVPSEERSYFRSYPTPFAFSSNSWHRLNFKHLNLLEAKRQSQSQAQVLNRMRRGEFIQDGVNVLSVLNESGSTTKSKDGALVLALTNARADSINNHYLKTLPGKSFVCEGIKKDTVRELPVPEKLQLKIEARVLILKNNGDIYCNGDTGVIKEFDGETISVFLDRTKQLVEVERNTWEYFAYGVTKKDNGSEVVEKRIEGTYTQFPIKLGWAITVHKSQGMSLNEFTLDLERSTFAHGQAYVGISRIRDLSNLSLGRAIRPSDFIIDENVNQFYEAHGLS